MPSKNSVSKVPQVSADIRDSTSIVASGLGGGTSMRSPYTLFTQRAYLLPNFIALRSSNLWIHVYVLSSKIHKKEHVGIGFY